MTLPTNAVIYYVPDGYSTSGNKLMGRQAAGAGFLHAFARSSVDHFYCYAPDQAAARSFSDTIQGLAGSKPVSWISLDRAQDIGQVGCLYLPGPSIGEYARRRAKLGDHAYSLCGITHTTASHGVMETIGNLLVDPVRPWDALICTSRAVRDSAKCLLEQQAEYLRWRLGASRFELPQLPVIPLGVDCNSYEIDAATRQRARAALGIGENEVAFLFVGRLSFHAKAHPLPMYLALERAANGRRVHLIQAGWFANAAIERAFREGAQKLCPSINMIFLDGRDAEQRQSAWAASDVFTSLSDNIQETFGLTPIEAMAAGLPVVVTDWDGYKDTVRDGVDGFRVPTLMPPEPMGADLAERYDLGLDSYDMYCGHTSQLVAVDVEACTQAYARLIESPALRRQMGEAGRARAREAFDWSGIIRRYQTLWDELGERRRADADLWPPRTSLVNPARPDPFATFASYPTHVLAGEHTVSLAPDASVATLAQRRHLAMVSFARHVFPTEQECAAILKTIAKRGACTVAELLALAPEERRMNLARGLVWLAKLDILRIAPPATGKPGPCTPA